MILVTCSGGSANSDGGGLNPTITTSRNKWSINPITTSREQGEIFPR